MPGKRKNERICCTHFIWLVGVRHGVYYADGRSNELNAGRHSLGTRDYKEALKRLAELDIHRAADFGLISSANRPTATAKPLLLMDGRTLYEEYIARPRATGGVKESTRKRYRPVFDKFLPFAQSRGIKDWNSVNAHWLNAYAADLEAQGYHHKTLVNELTVLKQTVKWLIGEGHLLGKEPVKLPLKKAESQRAYCYKPEEVAAIVEHCRSQTGLQWLGDVVVGLACTGLRISEFASLRSGNIDLQSGMIWMSDESGYANNNSHGQDPQTFKSGRGRSFPIHPDFEVVLRRLPLNRTYAFYGPRGGRLKPDYVRSKLVKKVIEPLSDKFPTRDGERGFKHGRLHSFRHYFCSTCSNSKDITELMLMAWLGHKDSEMVRHYYHLNNAEAKRRMNGLDFLGGAGGRSASSE